MTSDLMGFDLFTVERHVFIRTQSDRIVISSAAFKILGRPAFINVFIDRLDGRVMLKYAEKEYENSLKVYTCKRNGAHWINSKELVVFLEPFIGRNVRAYGQKAGKDMAVFEGSK